MSGRCSVGKSHWSLDPRSHDETKCREWTRVFLTALSALRVQTLGQVVLGVITSTSFLSDGRAIRVFYYTLGPLFPGIAVLYFNDSTQIRDRYIMLLATLCIFIGSLKILFTQCIDAASCLLRCSGPQISITKYVTAVLNRVCLTPQADGTPQTDILYSYGAQRIYIFGRALARWWFEHERTPLFCTSAVCVYTRLLLTHTYTVTPHASHHFKFLTRLWLSTSTATVLSVRFGG